MVQLNIRLLGTFQVTINQEIIHTFATEKARALLAYLAVEQQHAHSRESLASLLWPEQEEDRARQNLRQALLHLRQALGTAEEYLEVNTQTVRLLANQAVTCDVNQLLETARINRVHQHRSADRCYPCLLRQEQITELYQGEFLKGFSVSNSEPYEEWVMLTREHIHQTAIQALNRMAVFYEKRGSTEQALFHARRLVQLEPWREESHRQLMRLMVCDGQYSAALAQFKHCQRMLQKEFGAEPGEETTQLFEAIRQGNGAQYCIQPSPPDTPIRNATFIGRRQELSEIMERLSNPTCRILTLLGPGGAGKTSLAIQAAEELYGLYPDGIFFVPLATAGNFDEMIIIMLDHLQIPIPPGGNTEKLLAQAVTQSNQLWILDTFEHLAQDSGRLAELMRNMPAIQVMVTSRVRLQLREEWVFQVEGLQLPMENASTEDSIQSDAVLLFENRARQLDQRFRITPERLPAVVSICRMLEGSPLGIELSAMAAMERGCDAIVQEIQQSLDSAKFGLRNVSDRHRSLRAVFEQSWQLLSQSEQTHLANLSIFPGNFSSEAASAICVVQERQLHALAAKSLLRMDDHNRFDFHAVIREFVREQLEQDPINFALIQHRHARFFGSLAKAALDGLRTDALLFNDRPNLLHAWHWSLRQPELVEMAHPLLSAIVTTYQRRGPLPEGIALLEKSLEACVTQPESMAPLIRSIQFELASLLGALGDFERAFQVLEQSLAGREPHTQPDHERYRYLYHKGRLLAMQGESLEAHPLLDEALTLARRQGDPRQEADCQRELGTIAIREGDSLKGREHSLAALAHYQAIGNQAGVCALTNNIGISYWDTGELDQAASWLEKALSLYREMKDLRGEAKALINLSNVMADRGYLSQATGYLQSAKSILIRIGNRTSLGSVMHNLGSILLALGQMDKAQMSYQEAMDIFIESNNRQAQAEILTNLGLLQGLLGEYPQAFTLLRQAEQISLECGDKINIGNALYYRARFENETGWLEQAQQSLEQCRILRRETAHAARQLETDAESAHLHWRAGEFAIALDEIEPVLAALNVDGTPEGVDDPMHLYWLVYEILQAAGDPRANNILQDARKQLLKLADKIEDPLERHSFLNDYPTHRLIRDAAAS
ncbi:MAG: tetratricopeptide repeat protein [Anaerolineae bacterium]|nr:tetratricopeptide repeat protein [Anaerolineae bacterium]